MGNNVGEKETAALPFRIMIIRKSHTLLNSSSPLSENWFVDDEDDNTGPQPGSRSSKTVHALNFLDSSTTSTDYELERYRAIPGEDRQSQADLDIILPSAVSR